MREKTAGAWGRIVRLGGFKTKRKQKNPLRPSPFKEGVRRWNFKRKGGESPPNEGSKCCPSTVRGGTRLQDQRREMPIENRPDG